MVNDIESIKARNRRVEADKAWETSKTRKVIIATATYLTVALFLHLINAPKPWLNAIVPATGFLLSTLTLSVIKERWMKQFVQ